MEHERKRVSRDRKNVSREQKKVNRELWIVGAGGHAKVVADAAIAAGWLIGGVYDPNMRRGELSGVTVVDTVPNQVGLQFVVAVGDNSVRKLEFERFVSLGFSPVAIIHPSACISGSASVAAGTVVMARAVLQADCAVAENCIINTAAVVEHDCTVSAHSHVGPGSVLCGGVVAKEGAFIGAGATIIPDQEVGEWAVVAAGATVISKVVKRTTVVGTPAQMLQR